MNSITSVRILNLVRQIKRSLEIKEYSYVEESGDLRVVYKSDTYHLYYNIPKNIYDYFNTIDNKEDFLRDYIRPRYSFKISSCGEEHEAFDRLKRVLDPGIKNMCTRYYLKGFDKEDVYQIAIETLYKAIQDFSEDKNTTFEHFALKICIRKRLITEISRTKRQKSRPLNNYRSLDTPIITESEDNSQTLGDLLLDEDSNPLDMLLEEEEKNSIKNLIYSDLTELEAAVLDLKQDGASYREISDKLMITVKCVDNSLGRVKKKAKILLENNPDVLMEKIYLENEIR